MPSVINLAYLRKRAGKAGNTKKKKKKKKEVNLTCSKLV
jgi:hypothetical protein